MNIQRNRQTSSPRPTITPTLRFSPTLRDTPNHRTRLRRHKVIIKLRRMSNTRNHPRVRPTSPNQTTNAILTLFSRHQALTVHETNNTRSPHIIPPNSSTSSNARTQYKRNHFLQHKILQSHRLTQTEQKGGHNPTQHLDRTYQPSYSTYTTTAHTPPTLWPGTPEPAPAKSTGELPSLDSAIPNFDRDR